MECIWQARVLGDNQIFQKEEAANVYGIVVLKNLFWPGWVTLGYVLILLIRKEDLQTTILDMVTRLHSQLGVIIKMQD